MTEHSKETLTRGESGLQEKMPLIICMTSFSEFNRLLLPCKLVCVEVWQSFNRLFRQSCTSAAQLPVYCQDQIGVRYMMLWMFLCV